MERVKKQLRINTLSLNYQNIYSILVDSYFTQLDEKSVISIPFLTFLYKTYPALMVRLVSENYSVLYGHILRLKHPLFFEAVRQSPQLLVDCVRIHLERIDVIDVFKLQLGNTLLDPYINNSISDSIMTSKITSSDLSAYEIESKANETRINVRDLRNLIYEVVGSDKRFTLSDTIETKDQLKIFFSAPRNSFIDRWRERIQDFLLGRSEVIAQISTQNDYTDISYLDATKSIVLNLNKLQINRILLHNLILTALPQTDDWLYQAFMMFPFSLTLVKDMNLIFNDAIDVTFFRSPQAAIEFYVMATGASGRSDRNSMQENIMKFKSSDYLKFSLFDVNLKIEDVPNSSIQQHNAVQLANRVLKKAYQPFLASDLTETQIGVIDHVLFLQAVADKVSIIPSQSVSTSLDETLEEYKNLLPQSAITAILLLLLYNSSNYRDWIEIFKKHKETMQQIIARSVLLSEFDKKNILNII